MIKTIGISTEDFVENLESFNKVIKKTIESHLTPQEIEEINNPKTKKKRIKQLIKISDERIAREYYLQDIGGVNMADLKVDMYIRTFDDFHRGKIGKIIKCYNGELQIDYKNRRVNTTISKFLDDNRNYRDGLRYKTSYDIKDLIMAGDLIEDTLYGINEVIGDDKDCLEIGLTDYTPSYASIKSLEIISIVTKEEYQRMKYEIK